MTTTGVTGDEVVIKWNNAGVQVFNYIAFSLGIAINIGSKPGICCLMRHPLTRPIPSVLATRREQIFSLARRPNPRLSSWRVRDTQTLPHTLDKH